MSDGRRGIVLPGEPIYGPFLPMTAEERRDLEAFLFDDLPHPRHIRDADGAESAEYRREYERATRPHPHDPRAATVCPFDLEDT